MRRDDPAGPRVGTDTPRRPGAAPSFTRGFEERDEPQRPTAQRERCVHSGSGAAQREWRRTVSEATNQFHHEPKDEATDEPGSEHVRQTGQPL